MVDVTVEEDVSEGVPPVMTAEAHDSPCWGEEEVSVLILTSKFCTMLVPLADPLRRLRAPESARGISLKPDAWRPAELPAHRHHRLLRRDGHRSHPNPRN